MTNLTVSKLSPSLLASAEHADPPCFPELYTLSPAFFLQFVPVAKSPQTPEVIFVPTTQKMKHIEMVGVLATWNHLWEASQYRKEAFNLGSNGHDIPELTGLIKNLPEANTYLVADSRTRYDAYAPLYHLLPKRLLDRHGLPALKRPLWPNNGVSWWTEDILPARFQERLGSAFAAHVWSHIDSGSPQKAFSADDSLVLLSHNLDYWLPPAIQVIEGRMREFDRVKPENCKQRKLMAKANRMDDPDVDIRRPHMGGHLWMGEQEADQVTSEIVNVADSSGKLRAIIDAIRSNRVIDDFSSCWSFAREDFERKIYSKRSKVRVSFVELDDTLPVHSPQSEYTDDLLWEDFSTVLDTRERHIVVCLRSGFTRLGDIATSLGYANHSPVSKALSRIRTKAAKFLNLN